MAHTEYVYCNNYKHTQTHKQAHAQALAHEAHITRKQTHAHKHTRKHTQRHQRLYLCDLCGAALELGGVGDLVEPHGLQRVRYQPLDALLGVGHARDQQLRNFWQVRRVGLRLADVNEHANNALAHLLALVEDAFRNDAKVLRGEARRCPHVLAHEVDGGLAHLLAVVMHALLHRLPHRLAC